MPDGQLTLQEPPVLAETVPDTSAIWTYLPMALMSVSMMLMFLRPGGGNGVFMYLAMGVMALSAGAMLLGQLMRRSSERKQRLKGERRDYLRYLTQTRKRVRTTIAEQQRALAWRHPEPASLRSLARTSRLWERRPADEDFGEVRLAVGEQQLALTLNPVSTRPVEDLEPLCAHALRRFIRAYSTIPTSPSASTCAPRRGCSCARRTTPPTSPPSRAPRPSARTARRRAATTRYAPWCAP